MTLIFRGLVTVDVSLWTSVLTAAQLGGRGWADYRKMSSVHPTLEIHCRGGSEKFPAQLPFPAGAVFLGYGLHPFLLPIW